MLEALEHIRQAEKNNQQKYEEVKQKLQAYKELKEKELKVIKKEKQQHVQQLVDEKTLFEQRKSEEEKKKLIAEAVKLQQKLQIKYQNHQEEVVNAIIERMKKSYGC